MRQVVLLAALILSSLVISANAQQQAPSDASLGAAANQRIKEMIAAGKTEQAKVQAARMAREANPLALRNKGDATLFYSRESINVVLKGNSSP